MRKLIWIIVFIFPSIVGAFLFSGIPLERQAESAQSLLWVGMTLFAILGVWISVLDPTNVLNQPPGEELSERDKLAQDLLSPWLVATFVFALAFILIFILNFLPTCIQNKFIQGIIGFFVIYLFLLNLYVLVGTILPIVRIQYRKRENSIRKKYRSK